MWRLVYELHISSTLHCLLRAIAYASHTILHLAMDVPAKRLLNDRCHRHTNGRQYFYFGQYQECAVHLAETDVYENSGSIARYREFGRHRVRGRTAHRKEYASANAIHWQTDCAVRF